MEVWCFALEAGESMQGRTAWFWSLAPLLPFIFLSLSWSFCRLRIECFPHESFRDLGEFILVKHWENSAWHIVSTILCLLNKYLSSWSCSETQYILFRKQVAILKNRENVSLLQIYLGFSISRHKELFLLCNIFLTRSSRGWQTVRDSERRKSTSYSRGADLGGQQELQCSLWRFYQPSGEHWLKLISSNLFHRPEVL